MVRFDHEHRSNDTKHLCNQNKMILNSSTQPQANINFEKFFGNTDDKS